MNGMGRMDKVIIFSIIVLIIAILGIKIWGQMHGEMASSPVQAQEPRGP